MALLQWGYTGASLDEARRCYRCRTVLQLANDELQQTVGGAASSATADGDLRCFCNPSMAGLQSVGGRLQRRLGNYKGTFAATSDGGEPAHQGRGEVLMAECGASGDEAELRGALPCLCVMLLLIYLAHSREEERE